MKYTLNYFVTVICLAVLAISCQKAQETIAPEKASGIHTLSVAFPTMEELVDSKVSLSTAGVTQWEANVDKLVIFGKGSYSTASNRVVHTIASEDIAGHPKKAVFSVDLSGLTADPSATHDFNVIYPYTEGNQYNYSSDDSNYGRARFQNTNQILMAGYVSDDKSTIDLTTLTAAITFSVADGYDAYVFQGANGNAANDEVVGYSNLIVEMNGPDAPIYRQKFNDGGTSGPLSSITGDVTGDGEAVNYIFLPVNTKRTGTAPDYSYDPTSQRGANAVYLPHGFTILLKKSGVIKKYITSTAPVSLSPGQMINLGLLPSTKMYDYEAIPADEKATATDLSDIEPGKSANCYIVSAVGTANDNKVFKFPTVKGNSFVKGSSEGTSVGSVVSAEVLWETWNNNTTPTAKSIIKEVEYKDGFIYFKTPETLHEGNALIAAKDSEGNILWSWHIWVPSTTITSSTYGDVSKVRMMDRNLGALVIAEGDADNDIAVESCGLFYQWGRKDPFPGPGSLPGGYDAPMAKVNGSIGTRGQTSYTVINKYPNSFVVTGSPESDATKDWSSDHSASLWGSVKNENDPCPPGWKLPIFASSTGDLWDKDVTDKTALAGYSLNTTHHWLKLGVDFDGDHPSETGFVYFPLAGYRTQDAGQYDKAGDRALIWQAYGEDGSYAKCLYSDGSFVGFRNERKGRGGNVRCVAE